MIPNAIREQVLAVGKRLAQQAITYAAGIPGNVSGKQREDVAVEYLQDRVTHEIEARDHLLPTIGRYMDLPVVDFAQRRAEEIILRAFIRQVYAEQELRKLA